MSDCVDRWESADRAGVVATHRSRLDGVLGFLQPTIALHAVLLDEFDLAIERNVGVAVGSVDLEVLERDILDETIRNLGPILGRIGDAHLVELVVGGAKLALQSLHGDPVVIGALDRAIQVLTQIVVVVGELVALLTHFAGVTTLLRESLLDRGQFLRQNVVGNHERLETSEQGLHCFLRCFRIRLLIDGTGATSFIVSLSSFLVCTSARHC